MIKIAIDAMGGDSGLAMTIPGALKALQAHNALHLVLVGKTDGIQSHLQQYGALDHPGLSIYHAEEVVEMDEKPSAALRYKKKSSMRLAINLVKEGQVDACVSAGNTGALMATSRFVLKMIPGIDRPAIVYALPSQVPGAGEVSSIHMLDLGANLDCTEEHLFQFAQMGSVLRSCVTEDANPRVALLNIGEEEIKGLESIKNAAKLLSECPDINYTGYVEGNDIFNGTADVIVCDGFTGNVALKTTEGVAKFLGAIIKKEFNKNLLTRLTSIGVMPVLMKIKSQLDLNQYNGASLLGLRGTVVKSHGGADEHGFATAIHEAVSEVNNQVPDKIAKRLSQIMGDA